MNCTCDYNLLRKGLADEQCEECYKAFIEKENKYYKMLNGILALETQLSFEGYHTLTQQEFDYLFGGVL